MLIVRKCFLHFKKAHHWSQTADFPICFLSVRALLLIRESVAGRDIQKLPKKYRTLITRTKEHGRIQLHHSHDCGESALLFSTRPAYVSPLSLPVASSAHCRRNSNMMSFTLSYRRSMSPGRIFHFSLW